MCKPYQGNVWEEDTKHESFYDPIPYDISRDDYALADSRMTSQQTFRGVGSNDACPSQQGIALDEICVPDQQQKTLSPSGHETWGHSSRLIRPRYLCFLNDTSKHGYRSIKVKEWIEEHGDEGTEFVFVSYTRKQFCVNTDQEISEWPHYRDEEERDWNREAAKRDRETLTRWGVEAAKEAGVGAFWIDFECLREEDGSTKHSASSDDVYFICDVVRSAHSMIIAVGPPIEDRVQGKQVPYCSQIETRWLQQWGSRLWTLPEILLCPPEHRVKLYTAGGPLVPKRMAKRNFAERAWNDAETVVELLDYYESRTPVSQLEFISIALDCLARRHTDQFCKADIVYALMGLLRKRLKANEHDTGFQAFARLSLANDSNRLLERTLCMLPLRRDAPWTEIRDAWGAELHEVEPKCQIAEVMRDDMGNDIIVIEGAYGATIHWDCLDPIQFSKEISLVNKVAARALVTLPCFIAAVIGLLIQVGLLGFDPNDTSSRLTLTFAMIVFIILMTLLLSAPVILIALWGGTLHSTQARFVGIKGHIHNSTIERYLFGYNHGRLREDPTIARAQFCHAQNEIRREVHSLSVEDHLFTLVDTYSMTVTRFSAARPPTAILVCGQAKGMQRAVLCSYDHTQNTFCRQTILQMKTDILERMFTLGKVRFTLQEKLNRTQGPIDQDAQNNINVGRATDLRDGIPTTQAFTEDNSFKFDDIALDADPREENDSSATLPEAILRERGFVGRIDIVFIPVMWVSESNSLTK